MVFLWIILSFMTIPQSINVEGEYVKEDQIYIYGSYQGDGYLLSYQQNSDEILFEMIYQRELNTTIIYLADVLDGMIVVVRSSQQDTLDKYDYDGTLIHSMSLGIQNDAYHNHHGLLVIENEGQTSYINQAMKLIEVIPIDYSSEGKVDIQFQGEGYIDDIKVDDLYLEEVGIYKIDIIDGSYQFNMNITILPSVIYHNGIDEFTLNQQTEIEEPIQIFANVDHLLLNGQPYDNEFIYEPGIYQLILMHNGYEIKQISFSIYPYVEGLIEGVVDDQRFYVFGQAYLNQVPVSGDVYVDEPGHYELIIYFNHEIYQSHTFSIETTSNHHSYLLYTCLAIILTGLLIKFLKK